MKRAGIRAMGKRMPRRPFWVGSLLALFLLIFAVGAGGNAGDPPGLAKAKQAQARHTEKLLAKDGIVGIGLTTNAAGQGSVAILVKSNAVRGVPSCSS